MSEIFFQELDIPPAEINLGVGSGRHGAQTAKMLAGIEEALLKHRPDLVVVFGDTNSTIAGALAAVKLGIPSAHVESGLRSFNRAMPEEINRIVADHTSDLLLAPTTAALQQLKKEGLASKAVVTGDIMCDTVLQHSRLAEEQSTALDRLAIRSKEYYLATVHRAENTDDLSRLLTIMQSLNKIAAAEYPVIFPIHPRTRKVLEERLSRWQPHHQVRLIDPVGYLDMLQLLDNSRLILTDSGGLQKEAFYLNTPCITLRDQTEWVETVEAGGNTIVGADRERILKALADWEERLEREKVDFSEVVALHFGAGQAAQNSLTAIREFVASPRLTGKGLASKTM